MRFKTVLGFSLDAGVAEGIRECKHLLSQVSGERVFSELKRIITSPGAYQGLMDLHQYGLSAIVLPELDKAPAEAAQAVSMCPPDLITRLAVLLGITGAGVDGLRSRFNLPSKVVTQTEWLALNCEPEVVLDKRTMPKGHAGLWKTLEGNNIDPGYMARRIVYHWGEEQLQRLIEVKRAVWLGRGKTGLPYGYLRLAAGYLSVLKSDRKDFMEIALDGNEIMELLGVGQGQVVGEAIEYLEDLVLQNPEINRKQTLSQILLEWWSKRS